MMNVRTIYADSQSLNIKRIQDAIKFLGATRQINEDLRQCIFESKLQKEIYFLTVFLFWLDRI